MNHLDYPSPHELYDDEDDDVTIVQPSLFPSKETMIGYSLSDAPSAVRHTFTEPSCGYPVGAAYVPLHEAEDPLSNGYVIAMFAAHPVNQLRAQSQVDEHAHMHMSGAWEDAQQEPTEQHARHHYVQHHERHHYTHPAQRRGGGPPRHAPCAHHERHHYTHPAQQDCAHQNSAQPEQAWAAYDVASTTPRYEAPATPFEAPEYPRTPSNEPCAVHLHHGEPLADPTNVDALQQMASFPQSVADASAEGCANVTPSETPSAAAGGSPSPNEPESSGRAFLGALLGAVAGAVLWGAIGFATGGYELKYGAVLIGLLTGGGASLLGRGTRKSFGVLGGVFGLVGIVGGKALFELLLHADFTLAEHIAYHSTVIDFIFFGATIVTGFAVGSGTLAPSTIVRRGRYVLRRILPAIISG